LVFIVLIFPPGPKPGVSALDVAFDEDPGGLTKSSDGEAVHLFHWLLSVGGWKDLLAAPSGRPPTNPFRRSRRFTVATWRD